MAILATLPNPSHFTPLPTTPPTSSHPPTTPPPKPPIPIPKYSPISKTPKNPSLSPAFKTHHRNSKYYKPIKPGQTIPLPESPNRAILVGDSGISYLLPNAPFEFMFSYSETPKAQPIAMREPAFLPFAPPSMPRPWTGKAPLKKSKRKIKLFEPLGRDSTSSSSDDEDENESESESGNGNGNVGGRRYEMLRDYELMKVRLRPREEVLGEPLTRWEIKDMLKKYLSSNRQVNLGRDGLTHNMLELIHTHWRRLPVCKVRCLGVPTVDMDNVCRCLEEKSGGKIIHRVGGVVYLFRGRNYDHQKRPQLPVMLWKPAAPVYPKLIQEAPEGLTKRKADELRNKGKTLMPICKLAKNGVYISLVRDVRTAFEGSILVKIDCRGLDPSDYKKIGAKLKELVPCVLLSFDDEQILMWRGKEWKSMYEDEPPKMNRFRRDVSRPTNVSDAKSVRSSPKMMSLWQRAIESGRASVVDEIDRLSPDELLSKVDEFDRKCQAIEHSYPARIYSQQEDEDDVEENNSCSSEDDDDDSFEVVEPLAPLGSLPIDLITTELSDGADAL